jgi:uncharacterized protein (TIGR00661 family)
MKILYAVQATGNGHISRAMELVPYLQYYGKVDIFLSGDNSSLEYNAPIKFRSKGLSLYYNCKGGIDFWRTAKAFQLSRIRKEIRDLPVEKYDLIINDFEYITAAACAQKKIYSVNFGHQASFQSPHVPRPPKKSMAGEWILKNYAKASRYVGLHFRQYDQFIFPPVIKREVREADPTDKKYITVYLPSYCEQELKRWFGPIRDLQFEIFSKETKMAYRHNNIHFMPVDKTGFNRSLIHCSGIITSAGFETPAEALYLEKKLMCIPIKSQYEQLCNAAALMQMGIFCLSRPGDHFKEQLTRWINAPNPVKVDYTNTTDRCLEYLFKQEYNTRENYYATPAGMFNFLL